MLGKRKPKDQVLRFSFCHKSPDQVKKLIGNPSEPPDRVYICDQCIRVCNSILEDDEREKSN